MIGVEIHRLCPLNEPRPRQRTLRVGANVRVASSSSKAVRWLLGTITMFCGAATEPSRSPNLRGDGVESLEVAPQMREGFSVT